MRLKNLSESGFSTPLAMAVIFSLCVLIISLSLLINSKYRKTLSYRRMYEARNELIKLLESIEMDMQSFTEVSCDKLDSEPVRKLCLKYADCNLTIKDVSTGINKEFIKESFLEKEHVQRLIQLYGDEVLSDYGWINPSIVDIKTVQDVQKDFAKEDVFPIINNFPVLNIYSMNEVFIEAILKVFGINKAEEKARELYLRLSENLDIKTLAEFLEIPETNNLFNMIGTKTAFWEVCFENKGYFARVIFAAIPERDSKCKIDKYMVIEKDFTYKGGK